MNREQIKIYQAFDGKLLGNSILKSYVCEAVALLPENLVSYVTHHCWFVSSLEDAWGFTFTGNDLVDQHLIFLSEDLLHQPNTQVHYTILHEIGHVIYKHRNSVNITQTAREIKIQEQQADQFAKKYLLSAED